MFNKVMQSIIEKSRRFLIVWGLIIATNQIVIFGACFAPYCLAAALPHTFVLAALLNFFAFRDEKNSGQSPKPPPTEAARSPQFFAPSDDRPVASEDSCPVCGNQMVKRLARRGPRSGKHFYGCAGYPDCRGIRNIDD